MRLGSAVGSHRGIGMGGAKRKDNADNNYDENGAVEHVENDSFFLRGHRQ